MLEAQAKVAGDLRKFLTKIYNETGKAEGALDLADQDVEVLELAQT
jgi:hypothetical protein